MRTFILAAVCAIATASYGRNRQVSYGTTGHYGNQYGHGGNDVHDHQDHIYGYDSVKTKKALKDPTNQAAIDNEATRVAIVAQVEAAHTARLNAFRDVLVRKKQRLDEIKLNNDQEIQAPFDYQKELLRKEEDDITVALTEAFLDANAAFDDMIVRLERLYADKIAGLADEIEEIIRAIERSEVDRKNACEVLQAMRLEIVSDIECDAVAGTATLDADYDANREYEGLFDDFHYDIGHGKGTGEGDRDNGPVRDGYGGGPGPSGPIGDYEVDVGARTRSWEGNLYAQPY